MQNPDQFLGTTHLEERLWIYFYHFLDHPNSAKVRISECRNCGYLFTNRKLSQADLAKKYTIVDELGRDAARHRSKPPYLRERQNRVMNWLSHALSTHVAQPLRVLDYGGAEGYLMLPFADRGDITFVSDYIAYPLADERIKYTGKDINDVPKGTLFDLVFCLHTLEHVSDPVAFLKELITVLADEGYLYVEVPLGAWLEWNDLREPLTHVNFFSEQSLCYILEAAGLKVVQLQSNWQYVTHDKHLCINILGQKTSNRPSSKAIKPLTSRAQQQPWRYLAGGLRVNFRYFMKQFVRYFFA